MYLRWSTSHGIWDCWIPGPGSTNRKGELELISPSFLPSCPSQCRYLRPRPILHLILLFSYTDCDLLTPSFRILLPSGRHRVLRLRRQTRSNDLPRLHDSFDSEHADPLHCLG